MVRWVIGLILHGGPIKLFSFQPVLHDWGKKGFRMMHIKEPLLLIRKNSPCDYSRFPLLLSKWSLTMCVVNKMF